MVKRTWVLIVTLVLAGGCTDRRDDAPHPRIISYSPAVTDIIFDLGLADHLVGVTAWCILPDGQKRPVVGDERRPNTEAIRGLRPDVIFIQQDPSPFQPLLRLDPNVSVVSVKTDSVEGILASIRTIAQATGAGERGDALAGRISARLEALRRRHADGPRPRVLFTMGYDHPATCGAGTYLDELITIAGGHNVTAEKYTGWPTINADMVLALAPDVLICQTNPEDAEAASKYWTGLSGLPAAEKGRIVITTDKRITILGSRVADTAEEFALWIHGSAGATGPATAEVGP